MSEPTAPSMSEVPPPPKRSYRALVIALAVVAILGVSLAFGPVRTFAAQVLSVFRVQKIATVSLTSADLEQIGDALSKGDPHVSLKELGDIWVEGGSGLEGSEPTPTTLAAAQAAVDFPVLVPADVEGVQTVLLQPGQTIKFQLHVAKVNELLRYYGAEKLLSKSVDGKTFSVTMAPSVYVTYGNGDLGFVSTESSEMLAEEPATSGMSPDPSSQEVFTVQTRGPQISVPEGVNPAEIRDVLLGLPFLPASLREQLAGVSDWQNTLIVPNLGGSTRQTTVAGYPGVIISEPQDPDMQPSEDESGSVIDPDEEYGEYAAPVGVMWQQDGVLRAVATTSEAQSLKIAESMAR